MKQRKKTIILLILSLCAALALFYRRSLPSSSFSPAWICPNVPASPCKEISIKKALGKVWPITEPSHQKIKNLNRSWPF